MDIKSMLMLDDLDVFEVFKLEAKAMGRKVFTDKDNYLFAKGTDRICLVAHIDTVGGDWTGGKRVPIKKRLQEKYGMITAFRADDKHRRTILGADDRAGCHGLLEIMREDTRPHILLCNYEECGGRGVREFTNETEIWKNFDFMVELDRAGCNEYVQYNNNPQDVHEFMAKFGIANAGQGSYSDIATISAATHIPSVNIAIGYRAQHSDREYLDLAAMNLAIEKTKLIIHRYCKDKPNLGKISERKYREHYIKPTTYTWKPKIDDSDEIVDKCVDCGQTRGEHYRSCPSYIEDKDQQAFPFD